MGWYKMPEDAPGISSDGTPITSTRALSTRDARRHIIQADALVLFQPLSEK